MMNPVPHWKTTAESTAVMFIAPNTDPLFPAGEMAVIAAREKTPLIPEVMPTTRAPSPPTQTAGLHRAAARRKNQLREFAVLTFLIAAGRLAGVTTTPLVRMGPIIIPTLTRELQNRADAGDASNAAANQETPHSPWNVSSDAEDMAHKV